MMVELQMLNGPLQWQTVKVAGPRFLIGRRDGCHLVLKDGWISREHAVLIEKAPGDYVVQDLDSENGVQVNGVRITEAPLKHSDILRVGRTEMRFFCVSPAEAASRRESTVHDAAPRPAIRAGSVPQTSIERISPFADVPTDPADAPDLTIHEAGGRGQRGDMRERFRRIEKLLQEKEEENARLATENAVLKRAMASAGLINRTTGLVDFVKLRTPPPRELVPPGVVPLTWNPLSQTSFPDPSGGPSSPALREHESDVAIGAFRIGVVGAGAAGARLADAFHATGYRRTVALSTDAAVLADLSLPSERRVVITNAGAVTSVFEGRKAVAAAQLPLVAAFREGLGTDRNLYLLTFGLGGSTGAGALGPVIEYLAEFEKLTRAEGTATATPSAAIMTLPFAEELGDADEKDRRREGLEAARTLFEAGRLRPFVVCDRRRLAAYLPAGLEDARTLRDLTIAGAVDALNRLAVMPPVSGTFDADALRALWAEPGVASFGLAATRDVSQPEALRRAVRHALQDGFMLGSVPASRARQAAIVAVIGSEVLAGGPSVVQRLESAVEEARGLLPQVRPVTGVYQAPGSEVRVIAWVGGLPFPEGLE